MKNLSGNNSNSHNGNPLGWERMPVLLFKFALPAIIAMVVSSLYNVVDQIFIGHGVGYLGNAATNVAFPLNTICIAIMLTLGIGSATRFSIYLGQKKEEDAAKVVGSGIVMMTIFGVAYMILVEIFCQPLLKLFGATDEILEYAIEYTKITAIGMPFVMLQNGISKLTMADGSPTYSMMTMLIGCILNTILDPIMIFVFHMGVKGAAIATVIGQIVSFIAALTYMWQFKRVSLKPEYFKFSIKETLTTIKMGMSPGLTQLAITLVQVTMNLSLVHYGNQSAYGSSIPLAGTGIVMKINAIVISVIIGLNQGLQPILGFNYGARNFDRVKQAFLLAVKFAAVITISALIIFEVYPRGVIGLFGSGDENYVKYSIHFMRIFLCLLPLGAFQMLSANFFSSTGKAIKGAMLSLTRQVIFFIPLLLTLPLFMGFEGILWTGPIADFISFLVVLYFILVEFKKMSRSQIQEQ